MGFIQSATIIILTFVVAHQLTAQSGIVSLGARADAMGGASVALEDSFSPFNNIGASSYIKEPSIVSSFQHKFGFVPFQHFGAAIIYPSGFGIFSLTAQKFGADLYNEQQYSVGFSNKLGIVSLGVKVTYLQFTMQEMGSRGVATIAFGGIAKLIPSLTFGAHIYNLTQTANSGDEHLNVPVILRSGLSYKPINALIICLEAEKDLDYEARLKGGLEYHFLEKFYLRSGISSAPFQQHYGLGFSPWNFSLNYSLQNHTSLGISHQLSLTYELDRK